jgi:hypothetical protein
MKASLVAYDFRELHKNSELKIVKFGYVRGCPKQPTTQIWSLEILTGRAWWSLMSNYIEIHLIPYCFVDIK